MFNKKIKNIMFILLAIILICFIISLNYIVDPYLIFKNNLNYIPDDVTIAKIKLKLSKNKKYENLLIGGSDVICAFSVPEWYSNEVYFLAFKGINYKNYYELLKNFLIIHPETKNVFLSLSYNAMYSDGILIEQKGFNNENLTNSDIFRVLFSTEAFKDSVSILYKNYAYFYTNKNELWGYHPSSDYVYLSTNNLPEETLKINYEYINKIINLLEEKNINYTFFIMPYNILSLTLFYIREPHRKNIEYLKKFIVNKSKNPIYDMAFLNKYTSNDLKKDKYSLYYDPMHITEIFGIKVFKMLFDNNFSDKNSYLILNKDNIDKQIKYENALIKNYIEKNETKVNKYKELIEKNNPALSTYTEFYNIKNLPKEFKNDIIYINTRSKQNNI